LDLAPKGQAIKEKTIDTLNLSKIKRVCASKDTPKRVRRKPTEGEKTL